jgi:acyl-CoA hydrolase
MAATQLPDRQPTLRVVAMPNDVNALGSVFGGWIMAQVDIAEYSSGSPCTRPGGDPRGEFVRIS